MIRHAPELQAAPDETFSAFWAFLETVLEVQGRRSENGFRCQADGHRRSALVDGLWLERCFKPKSFSSKEAVRLSLDLVKGAGANRIEIGRPVSAVLPPVKLALVPGRGEVKALLQESLSIAVRTDAVKPSELSAVFIGVRDQKQHSGGPK
ncbi:hypothetical protein XH98_20720 [Bradyrhizobium sp. CCBAU 51745]|nr:hypothetical protein [Bradyrhizobium sp. CCBAU 51745]